MIKTRYITGIALLALAPSAFASGPGPAPVVLRLAGDFAILSKAGITDVPASAVSGDVGTSPITGAANLLTCTEVTGGIYSVNAAGPEPCKVKDPTLLTAAILDMEAAYKDAAGRELPEFTELRNGDIGGMTLEPDLYKWSSGVNITTSITLSGSPNSVWIFQIADNLIVGKGVAIHLAGGAQAKNVFWQVAGLVTLETTSSFEGNILSKTLIAMKTGASVHGRLLSQTAVTLEKNKVTKPTPE
jgi:hypothetical protein